jgi:peroxiredoxin Q/BCP
MSDAPAVGARAPEFTLPSTGGDVSLASLLAGGHRALVAFYFEDGTPSCQTEIAALRDAHEMLTDMRARVVAISADSLESHAAFAERLGGVPFPLASDTSLDVTRRYGVVDDGDDRRARRAVFVVKADGTVALALPHFQPNNLAQIEAIFAALGAEP